MKKLFNPGTVVLLLALAFTLTHCGPATVEPVDITSDIQALNQIFQQAFLDGDAAGVAARYTEDGVLYPPNSSPVKGQSAIQSFWQGAIDGGLSPREMTTVKATAYGDYAVEIGTVKLYVGDQMVDEAKFMVHWKKVDGEWKMYEDIWNTSLPLPPPPVVEEEVDEDAG